MSDSGLNVDDVCFEFSRLAAGMTVRWESSTGGERASKLVEQNHEGHWVDEDGCVFRRWFVKNHGVTILALPEEAPKPVAAPSLDEVPVGSRWRRVDEPERIYLITSRRADGFVNLVRPDGKNATTSVTWLRSNCTRIDEPAGVDVGKANAVAKSKFMANWDGKQAQREAAERAMPPARCAPGCVPAKPCRIVVPVTDKGTRYECPAFAEANIAASNTFREGIAWPKEKAADQAEARALRDQRWEPRSPMIGRYRFNRR